MAGGSPARQAGLVVAAVLAAHGMMLARGFVWDDIVLRQQQAMIGQWRLLTPDSFGFVRPGKIALFSMMEMLFGGRAIAWQAVALVVAVAAALLLWRWARTLVGPGAALAAALIYAVHPLHVEATGWFSALNGEVMVVLALVYYLWMPKVVERPTARRLCGLTLLFLLAVFFKEDAVAVPLIGLLSLWVLRVRPGRAVLGAVAVQYALAGAMILATRRLSAAAGQELEGMPYNDWLVSLHAPWMTVLHALAFLFPFRWQYYAYYQPGPALFGALTVAGWLLLVALAVVAWRRRRQPSALLFGLLMAVVALAPVMNLLPMHNTWFGVRYLAHAGIGLVLTAGWLVTRPALEIGRRRALTYAALGVWLAAAAAVAGRDHWIWRSNDTLFAKMVETHDSPMMHAVLANLRYEAGRYGEAEEHARKAIELGHPRANPRVILGMALARQGKGDEAVAAWREAERMEPRNIDLAMNLGYYHDERYAKRRDEADFEKADQYYALATRGAGANAEVAYVNRGLLWVQNGRLTKGAKIWEEGLEKFPGSEDLARNLSIARRRLASSAQAPSNP